MPYNGSGQFSRPVSDYTFDTVISETDVNNEMDGIATALSLCVTKDGQQTLTANIPFAGFKITGYGSTSSPNARTDVPSVGQVQDASFIWCGTATGTKNALALTPTPAITAYATGQRFYFKAGATVSDDAVTIAVSGLATKAAEINDAALSASVVIEANKYYLALYDGTAFQLTRLAGNFFADPMTTRGDIIVRNSSNVTARLAIGAADTAPVSDGTDLSYTGIIKQGTHTISVPAAAMYTRTTNGAAAGSSESSTNKVMVKTFDFDASIDEFVQCQIPMPKSWNEGTITAEFIWSHPSTTTNFDVVWAIQGLALGDSDALDAAFGTAQTVTDTGGTTDDIFISSATSAVTIAGTPAAGDLVIFQVYRDADNGSDTMAVDARLHAVRIAFTVNAADDS